MKKILNLYSGLGGNRKLWGNDYDITAVELDEETANVYKQYYPNDKVIIADAHKFLLENYMNYGFIWASPPCPSHSDVRRAAVQGGKHKAVYPDMTLYQEIILLMNFGKCYWVIENVKPYYKPLIEPKKELHRHLFWSNFTIGSFEDITKCKSISNQTGMQKRYGYDISKTKIKDKRKALRNMVDPALAKYILDCAMNKQQGLDGFFRW